MTQQEIFEDLRRRAPQGHVRVQMVVQRSDPRMERRRAQIAEDEFIRMVCFKLRSFDFWVRFIVVVCVKSFLSFWSIIWVGYFCFGIYGPFY